MSVKRNLDQWVEAGLISAEQRAAIEEFEVGTAEPTKISRGVEAIAYVGATLVLVALFMLGQELWDQIEAWGQLAVALIITAVLFAVGRILGRSEDAAIRRAQTFAWLLTVAGIALSGFVLISELLNLSERDHGIWVALIALAGAIALWLLRKSSLQMVAMGVTAAMTVAMLMGRFDALPDWAAGLMFSGLGVVWLLLTWGGVFTPIRTSYALGGIGLLLIAFPESNEMPWPLLGVLAAAVLLALAVRLGEQVLMGLGVVGLFIYVPMTIFEWFVDSLGAIVALLISGLILLGVVVGVVRIRR